MKTEWYNSEEMTKFWAWLIKHQSKSQRAMIAARMEVAHPNSIVHKFTEGHLVIARAIKGGTILEVR